MEKDLEEKSGGGGHSVRKVLHACMEYDPKNYKVPLAVIKVVSMYFYIFFKIYNLLCF